MTLTDGREPANPKASKAKPVASGSASKPSARTAVGQWAKPVASLDGRGTRLQCTARQVLAETEEKLRDVAFDEDHAGVSLVGATAQEFYKSVMAKAAKLIVSRNAIKYVMLRVDASSTKDREPQTGQMAALVPC